MSRRLMTLVGVLVLVGCLFCLTGCFSKQSVSPSVFTDKMENAGYTITDISDQYDIDIAEKVLLAVDPTETYQIEYFLQSSEEQAERSFRDNVAIMEENKGNISSSFSSNGQNFHKESLDSNGEYWVVCQVDRTFVYAHVSKEQKADVNKALDLLGY